MDLDATQGTSPVEFSQLSSRLPGKVIFSSDSQFDTARKGWNVLVDRQPKVIIFAENPVDVIEAVSYACQNELPVAVQATGHRDCGRAEGAVLINTSRMTGVRVNPQEHTAWVEAGAKWGDVLKESQKAGLAPLLGSTTDVGAVGYSLGGGLGWLSRKYGMSADSVLRVEVVTPDGVFRRASVDENSDLFWALRGGGGSFGVVTGMEIRLYPVQRVYAGNLIYPASIAQEVFSRFRQWVEDAPEELSPSIVLMNYPPLPHLPPALSGRSFVIVRGCYTGPVETGEELLDYWRSWQAPVIDGFKEIPFAQADSISQDPVSPMPVMMTSEWLSDLSDETASALIQNTLPQGGPPLLTLTEVRVAGGAIARMDPDLNAYSHREQKFFWTSIAAARTPEMVGQIAAQFTQLRQGLGSSLTGKVYGNFLDHEEMQRRVRDGYSEKAFRRLQAVREEFDPACRMVSGLNIPPLR